MPHEIRPHTVFSEQSSNENEGIFPSLQTLCLQSFTAGDNDWGSFIAFLAARVSSGKPLDMLKVSAGGHMCSDVKEGIEGMVGDFLAEGLGSQCPFGTCLDP